MLFNSYVFIFAFLPVVFFGFYTIGQYSHKLALLWLTSASLFFYGWWDVRFVGLLLGSIVFNYGAGYLIGQRLSISTGSPKWLLVSAIVANMILLGYFKYANFFIENLIQNLRFQGKIINEVKNGKKWTNRLLLNFPIEFSKNNFFKI